MKTGLLCRLSSIPDAGDSQHLQHNFNALLVLNYIVLLYVSVQHGTDLPLDFRVHAEANEFQIVCRFFSNRTVGGALMLRQIKHGRSSAVP